MLYRCTPFSDAAIQQFFFTVKVLGRHYYEYYDTLGYVPTHIVPESETEILVWPSID